MPTTRDEALTAKGRYGRANQVRNVHGEAPPFWYGQVVGVHSTGDYLQFLRMNGKPVWYHRDEIHLHPIEAPQSAT